ncbi:MAG: peptidoglycan-associated lipoprotein Pal [Xanthomonadales bacterium]|nr:peptidoglycan-associated lipoprotein Pal [Xanthomonadales bacterium]
MNTLFRAALVSTLVLLVAACGQKTKPVEPEPAPEPAPVVQPEPVSDGKYTPADLDTDSCLRQRVVYFDFDQDVLKPEFSAIVACHAKYLQDRPSARVTLEGHADERGSREYNMGLGERRGNAVSSAVQANGGSSFQLGVVSYGEERPICTDSNDSCWGQNRRVEIVYTAK